MSGYLFFNLHKKVKSENSSDNCKTLISSIGAIIKNPKMLQFVPDYFKTKKI